MNKNGTTSTEQGASAIEGRIEGIKESVKGLVDKGEKRVDEIRSRVVEVKDEAVTRGNAVLDKAVSFIKANPMKSVGLAFGVGYFAMRLFRR
jgi:ElaB/YqjD/DUF883 family membrane-anchored ribosome-binding protein